MTSHIIFFLSLILLILAGIVPFKYEVPLNVKVIVDLVAFAGIVLLFIFGRKDPTEAGPQAQRRANVVKGTIKNADEQAAESALNVPNASNAPTIPGFEHARGSAGRDVEKPSPETKPLPGGQSSSS